MLIGFGTDRGTVAAASDWDGPMEIKRSPARDDSYEGRSRDANIPAFFLETGPGQKKYVRDALAEPLLERAIGVIYRPERSCCHIISRPNCRGNSMPGSGLPRQARWPRNRLPPMPADPDETYPFGL